QIITEDKLAVEIIERALLSDLHLKEKFSVGFLPGGSETILTKYLPSFALSNSPSILVFLDGDKNTREVIDDGENIGDAHLSTEIKKCFGCDVKVHVSANDGIKNSREECAAKRKIINYYKKVVKYLPFNTPEEFLVKNLKGDNNEILKECKWDEGKKDIYKDMIRFICEKKFDKEDVSAEEIYIYQKLLLADIPVAHECFNEIRKQMNAVVKNGIL
ncbi:TPA: hypothetical protein R1156_004595, partial [Yersinia enterocolitica]|nr:hypothetical protein [Yersinia enterocolitica]